MSKAKISEIFISYQGEGPLAGSRQLFARFYGCNLDCAWCDTPQKGYKSFSREELLEEILSFGDDYNELAVTGGEPLLQSDTLVDILAGFKKLSGKPVLLETNGTLPRELVKVERFIDIISMDYKFGPFLSGKRDLSGTHAEFMSATSGKDLLVKAVVSDMTTIDDIKTMASVVNDNTRRAFIVLQPVTPSGNGYAPPDGEMLSYFKGYLLSETECDVMVLGQMHKLLGIR